MQSLTILAQYEKHFSPSTDHFFTPEIEDKTSSLLTIFAQISDKIKKISSKDDLTDYFYNFSII